MRADEINGISPFDEQHADDQAAQERADRTQSYAPAPASPQGSVTPVKSGTSTGRPAPGRGRAARRFTGDEARVQMALRPRTGHVTPSTRDAPTAAGSRGV
jgi:hypothetical protein